MRGEHHASCCVAHDRPRLGMCSIVTTIDARRPSPSTRTSSREDKRLQPLVERLHGGLEEWARAAPSSVLTLRPHSPARGCGAGVACDVRREVVAENVARDIVCLWQYSLQKCGGFQFWRIGFTNGPLAVRCTYSEGDRVCVCVLCSTYSVGVRKEERHGDARWPPATSVRFVSVVRATSLKLRQFGNSEVMDSQVRPTGCLWRLVLIPSWS
jgi:hypothetical protein